MKRTFYTFYRNGEVVMEHGYNDGDYRYATLVPTKAEARRARQDGEEIRKVVVEEIAGKDGDDA